MINKYSNWQKIDLHIHTDWSKKTKDGDYKGIFSVDTLKNKLIENEVAIFSLTDHNIINTDAYREYYEKYDGNEYPLLLVGVELDIKYNSRRYHSLLIFSESSAEKAEFLNDLLEKKFQEKNITNLKERVLEIKDIVDLFYKEEFFFIPHAHQGDTGIVKAYKENITTAQEMVLLMPSALEKVKEEVIHIYNQGFDQLKKENFKDRDDIAYINFSDNHNIEKYPCIHKGDKGNHDFYYIKGDKSFETLRLAFIDPESRIKSTIDYETIKHSPTYIEKLKIKDDGLLLENELYFSPHLNVLIGGRSSGKSLLLTLIGDKIDGIELSEKIKERYNVDYDKNEIKSSIDSGCIKNTKIDPEDIVYLDQGKIVKFFEEKKLKDLAEDAGKGDEYDIEKASFSNHKKDFVTIIENLILAYQKVYDEKESHRYVLHNSTIQHILNKEYYFRFEKENIIQQFNQSEQISDSQILLDKLSSHVRQLKTKSVLELKDQELEIIKEFEKLITNKKELIKIKKLTNQRISNFISNVDDIIRNKNTKLSDEAKNKDESHRLLKKTLSNIQRNLLFYRYLKINSDKLENFNYAINSYISINPDVKLVLEVEKKEDVKEAIIEGFINGEIFRSLFTNLIGLINNNKTIKNHNTNSPENLEKKINVQLKEIFNNLETVLILFRNSIKHQSNHCKLYHCL